jgi:hypothetical protein
LGGLLLALAVLVGGCSPTMGEPSLASMLWHGDMHAHGHCRSYRPIGTCSTGFHEVCQTTGDGCRQCSCVQ